MIILCSNRYEKQLRDLEEKLSEVYASAVESLDGGDEVNEEVLEILNGGGVERIDLSDRRLKLLPEALGNNVSLVSLNLSRNDLKVKHQSLDRYCLLCKARNLNRSHMNVCLFVDTVKYETFDRYCLLEQCCLVLFSKARNFRCLGFGFSYMNLASCEQ